MFALLGERISSPYLRLAIYHKQLSNKMKEALARDAILEIVSLIGISPTERENLLLNICNQYPSARETLSEKDILNHFYQLLGDSLRLRKFVAPEEMHWVVNIVHNLEIRDEIEQALYGFLLTSSDYNVKRRQFGWSLTPNSINKVVRCAIDSEDISLERRIEIAHEFGEPSGGLEGQYFKSLIQKKKYDQLKMLGDDMEDIVVSVVLHDINCMMFDDAIEIIIRLIPRREDLLREVIDMKSVFECAKREGKKFF